MGCGASTQRNFLENLTEKDTFEDYKITNKSYTSKSMRLFSNEMIVCQGCKKCFNIGSNQLSLNCSHCNKFFHCNIAGECIGINCIFKIQGNIVRARYCKDCSTPRPGNKCICVNCVKL